MDLDLARFRLNALSMLTASQAATGRSAADLIGAPASAGAGRGDDFMAALRGAVPHGQATAAAPLLPGAESGAAGVLASLEASNAAFLQRYRAKVDGFEDEQAVLTAMRNRIAALGEDVARLGELKEDASDAALKSGVRDFVAQYNRWDADFDPWFEAGGPLADNQAGNLARFWLRRDVGSLFHGAGHGGFAQGMTDMGILIGQDGQLRLDETAFEAALGQDREGVVQTLHNMAESFAGNAKLLVQEDHLLERRLDNLTRAVTWAAANQEKVETEFGPGAVAARLRAGYGLPGDT